MNFKKRDKTEFIILYRYPSDKNNFGKADLDRIHRASGCFGLGYHYVVRRDGTVEEGRSVDVAGFHDETYNHNSIAVCAIGVEATRPQIEALNTLFDTLKARYPGAKLIEQA